MMAVSHRAWRGLGRALRQHSCARYQLFHTFPLSAAEKQFSEKRLIGYSQQQLFDVVSDIQNYKVSDASMSLTWQLFLPWCLDSRVLRTTPTGCQAQLEIGFATVREKYISNVTIVAPNFILAASQDTQLFRRLVNEWRFTEIQHPAGPATLVDVKVIFEFENRLHSLLATAAFDKVVRKMVGAFESRARQLYGKGSLDAAIHTTST